jgi:hypothetical protein
MIIINDLKSLAVQDVNIKKPIKYSQNNIVHFDIYNKNEPLLLLTPSFQIMQKYSNKCIKFLDSQSFLEELSFIFSELINKVKNNNSYIDLFHKKKLYSVLEENNTILRCNTICEFDTTVFDFNASQISLDNLKLTDNVRLILYVKNIWVNDTHYGFNIKLSQIQRLEPLGLNMFIGLTLNSKPTPPPPPPPPNKLVTNTLTIKQIKKNEKSVKTNASVRPSLPDILNSIKKLRKTNLLS